MGKTRPNDKRPAPSGGKGDNSGTGKRAKLTQTEKDAARIAQLEALLAATKAELASTKKQLAPYEKTRVKEAKKAEKARAKEDEKVEKALNAAIDINRRLNYMFSDALEDMYDGGPEACVSQTRLRILLSEYTWKQIAPELYTMQQRRDVCFTLKGGGGGKWYWNPDKVPSGKIRKGVFERNPAALHVLAPAAGGGGPLPTDIIDKLDNVFASETSECGLDVEYLSGIFKEYNHMQIKQAVEAMLADGALYTTVDDDHYKTTS